MNSPLVNSYKLDDYAELKHISWTWAPDHWKVFHVYVVMQAVTY